MSKRSHIDSTDGVPDPAGPVSKRTRPEQEDNSHDALQTLLHNVDELASCLRKYQSEKAKDEHDSNLPLKIAELERLSKKLLPAVRNLKAQSQANNISSEITLNAVIARWTAATLSNSHPPLPAILDEALNTAALTHSGMTKNPSDASYERLEWVGDSYLYTIASSLVFQTFPDSDPGKLAQYREILIKNSTLAKYTRHYGLDKIANIPEEFKIQGRIGGTSASDNSRQKVLADLFEAYVGAVVISDPENGFQRATDWLKALWGSELEKEIRGEENKKTTTSQIGPKTELERAIFWAKETKIDYKDLPNYKNDKKTGLPLFTVGCFLTGWGETDKQLGFGVAKSKKEAGQKAAQMALDNKKLLQVYIDKKNEKKDERAAAEAKATAAAMAQEILADAPWVQPGRVQPGK